MLSTKKRKTEINALKVIELHNLGYSNAEITKMTKISKNIVTKHLRQANIPHKPGISYRKRKNIYCFNILTKEITKYNSALEASKILNVSKNSIYLVANGKNYYTKNFCFSYENLTEEEFICIYKKSRKVKKHETCIYSRFTRIRKGFFG